MTRVLGVDARFLLAAALLHALAIGLGSLRMKDARYGMAPSVGSAPAVPAQPRSGVRDLELNLVSQSAWAAAPTKPKARPAAKPAPRPGPGEVRQSPGYLLNPPPPYPEEARRQGQQGTVLLKVEVDDQGGARSVAVAKSSGFPLLDASALDTVRGWKFSPARLGGVAVSSTLELPIIFNLKDP